MLAAAAVLALTVSGAVPAWAESVSEPTPTQSASNPANLRWRAVDGAGVLQHDVAFHAASSAAGVSEDAPALVTDNSGQPDYVGLDLDPTPGAFEISHLADAAPGAGAAAALTVDDTVRLRTAAPAESSWQSLIVPATPDAPIVELQVAGFDGPGTGTQQPEGETPATEAPETEQPAAPQTDEADGVDADGAQDTEPPATEAPNELAPAPETEESGSAVPDDSEPTEPTPTRAPLAAADSPLRAAGPDAPGVTAPYVYWTAVDQNGTKIPGATFELAGPRETFLFWSTWARTVTVTDCTSAPCTGLDRDPDPGEFQVKFTTPDSNPTANPVSASSVYRVRQTGAPTGFTVETAEWRTTPGSGDTGNWGSPSYNFGAFANAPVQPAKIVVSTGGDRTGASGVSGLPGVVLKLNTGSASPSGTRPDNVAGDGAGWARCVSDANGECTFQVPNTEPGGENRDRVFWVVQADTGSVPTGWYANTSLSTGETVSSTQYRFRTSVGDNPRLRPGQTYRSGTDFMRLTSNSTNDSSSGVWQQSRQNPAAAQSCGIDVALILDISGSVGSSMSALKNASDTFVNSLVGTQSRMSLFSFAESSPAAGTQNYPTLTSVSTAAQAAAFQSRYTGWSANGGTNWDRALAATATAAGNTNPYDIAVIVTDGNPTFFGSPATGPGDRTRFAELENGIFSANALKQTGTRVLAIGVGAGASGASGAANLKSISGPTVGTDYFQTTDYAQVGQALRSLALGNCASQLTVTKMVVPATAPAGSVAGAVPAGAGWEFTVSDPSRGATLPNPATRTTEGDGTGTIGFPLTFAGGTSSGEVTLTETQQPGYTLQPVNSANAVCTNLVTGAPVIPSSNPVNGVRVAVPSGQTVNCIVYNRAPSQSATVQVDKVWQILDTDGDSLGTYRLPGDDGSLPAGLGGQLTLSGPGSAPVSDQDWGVARVGYRTGDSVAINEAVTIDAAQVPGCQLTSSALTKRGAATISAPLPATERLTPGANTFEITNVVTCASELTLLKSVEGGTAGPENWALTAEGTSGQTFTVPGAHTRSSSNSREVTAGEAYSLSERPADPAAPLAYLLDRVEQCVPSSAPGGCDWVVVDESQAVSVGIGQNATYRFVNKQAPALEVPLTGGLSSDALGLAGAGIAGLALLVGAATWNRRRTRAAAS